MAIFLIVQKEESEQKLLNFIERHTNASKNEIHKWIRKGDVRVNKKRVDAFDRINFNDEIRLPPFAELKSIQINEENKIHYVLDKIYEDSELLVINKDCGLAVQGGTNQEISIVDILKEEYPNCPFMPTPAHRLDKDTSGLLLIAKSYTMLRELHSAFSDKENAQLKKYYYAKVENILIDNAWQDWEDYLIIQEDSNGFGKTCISNNKEGQYALSKVCSYDKDKNILEIELITGRKHQIRAQASARNMPLLGDIKYGGKKADRLYLHAHKIIWKNQEFIAPIDW